MVFTLESTFLMKFDQKTGPHQRGESQKSHSGNDDHQRLRLHWYVLWLFTFRLFQYFSGSCSSSSFLPFSAPSTLFPTFADMHTKEYNSKGFTRIEHQQRQWTRHACRCTHSSSSPEFLGKFTGKFLISKVQSIRQKSCQGRVVAPLLDHQRVWV